MSYRACIFDLDGTLCDSVESIAWSGNHMLADLGMRQASLEDYKIFVGDGVDVLMRRLLRFGGDGGEGFAVDVDDEAGGGFVGLAAARHEGFNSVAKGGGIGIFREISGRFRMEGSGSSPGGGEHGTVRGVVLQIPDEGVDACLQVDAECLFSYQFHTSGSSKGPPSE